MVTIIQKHIILIVFLYFVTSINSQTIDEEYNPDYLKWLEKTTQEVSAYGFVLGEIPAPYKVHTELPEYLKEQIITRDFLARKYDLRDVTGALTSVKNQGGCGSCWTFATMGALEARWQITGKGTYDLSEDNLNTCHTPFLWAPCKGGNRELALAYLSRGSGPKLETDDPYSQYNTSVDCPDGLIPQGIVTSGWFLPSTDSDLLKNMIMDYGALYTNMRWEDASYNSANKTYYYSGTGSTNHAVLLVGWDDDKVTAGGTGAWIIKNSWGASMGESGYFYIAYQDSKVNSTVALFKDYKDYNPYETISTYSEAGWIGSFGYSSSSADALVKFSASGNIHLTKIGTYTNYPGAVVTIDIYDSFNGTNSLTGLLGSVSAQTCTYSGYHTFDIDEPISIEDGDDYYIKIRYQTTGYNYPIPVEMSSGGYVTAELETGVFWIKSTSGSNWSAITSTYDPCVYVYSNTNDIMLTDGSAYEPQPVIPNSNNNSIGRFKLNAQTSGAILNSINFTFSGTPSGINNVKLWSSSDSVYGGDTQIGESQLYSSTITFSGLTSEITEDGNYYFLTVDLGESTGEISAFISDNSAIEISGGTVAGTILNAKLSKDGNVLPVELISFNSTISFGKVLVNWQTATEVNNFGFEVERSTVKGEWLTIGFVEGAGNSNSPKYYSYTDFNVNSISAYKSDDILKYRLKQIDADGQIAYSDIIAINISELKSLPQEFSLEQNYPNPFNPVTTIGFNLPEKCNVKINVFNILGINITKITDREYQAGFHKAEFNAAYLPSGVYYYKIETSNGNSAVKKMLLLK